MVKVSLKAVQCSQININKIIIIKKKGNQDAVGFSGSRNEPTTTTKKRAFLFLLLFLVRIFWLVGWLVCLLVCLFGCLFGFVVVRSHLRCRRGRRGRRRRRRNTTLPPDSAPSTCRWPSTSSPFRFLFFFCDSTASRSFFGGWPTPAYSISTTIAGWLLLLLLLLLFGGSSARRNETKNAKRKTKEKRWSGLGHWTGPAGDSTATDGAVKDSLVFL